MTPSTIKHIRTDGDRLVFELDDDRHVSLPLSFSTRLAGASDAERSHWLLGRGGMFAHWPDVDEDIAIWDVLGIAEETYLRSARATPVI